MAPESGDKRRRALVPFEVGSILRAPYGWTDRMRREEGYPERGDSRRLRIGVWANLLIGLVLYGPIVVGGILGWRAWGSLSGAGLGVLSGLAVELVLGVATLTVVAFLGWRRSR